MTTISGFTFIHNAIESGYPIAEAIRAVQPYVNEVAVVDMQSTDGTRALLEKLNVKIIDGFWGNQAGETLRLAHNLYRDCMGDVIVHFEADEVYDDNLIRQMIFMIVEGYTDLSVYRLQLEQNFQRCRWYPEPVHRVFPRLSNTRKDGHTTNRHNHSTLLGPESGYLWDITNCFRDNWLNRVIKQAQLRAAPPQFLMVPIHCTLPADLSEHDALQWLYGGRHWEWKSTPFAIPEILKPLVGVVKYEPIL